MAALANSVGALLTQPIVGAGLGVVLGIGLFLAARWSVRLATPEAPNFGMVRTLVVNMTSMIVAFCALLLVFLYAREALVAFGIGLVVGFVVPTLVAMFTMSGTVRTSSTRR